MLQLIVLQGTVLLNMPAVGGTTTNPICVDRSLLIGNTSTLTGGLVKYTGAGNNQLQDSQPVTIEIGTLDFNGHNDTIGGVRSSLTTGIIENSAVGTTSVVTINTTSVTSGDNAFYGVIRDNSGTGGIIAITKDSIDGNQTLAGVNTYTGPTNILAGSLILSSAGSIANSSTINIASGATFDVSGTSGIYATGVGQTISGSGRIVGSYTHGQGTIVPGTAGTAGTLTFDNNITGGTATISGGAINFDISSSTSSGNDLIDIRGGNGQPERDREGQRRHHSRLHNWAYTMINQTAGTLDSFGRQLDHHLGQTRGGTNPEHNGKHGCIERHGRRPRAQPEMVRHDQRQHGTWSPRKTGTTLHACPDKYHVDDNVTFSDTAQRRKRP